MELAKKIFMKLEIIESIPTFLFHQNAGSDSLDAGISHAQKTWTPPPVDWIKFNSGAAKSIVNMRTAISFVCTDTNGCKKEGRSIGEVPVL